MFDTVNIWLPADKIRGKDFLSRVPPLLKRRKESRCPETDYFQVKGGLKNYTVICDEFGIYLRGSIAKYALGNDTFEFANIKNYRLAVEEMSDTLKLDINKGKVKRLDFGQNFVMGDQIRSYYPLLIGSSYLKRKIRENTLYFENNSKSIVFYDKQNERKNKGVEHVQQNLLRCELRLLRTPHAILKTDVLTIKNLTDKQNYSAILNRWYMEYSNIIKSPNSAAKLKFRNAKELKNMLALQALPNNEVEIVEYLEQGQKQGVISKVDAYRCRAMLAEIKKQNVSFSDSSLLDELNKKIGEAYKAIKKNV